MKRRYLVLAGMLLAAAALPSVVRALYVPPPDTFITDPAEERITLDIGAATLADVQTQIDSARAASPDAVLVVNLAGAYVVTDAPLLLPAKTCLKLAGTLTAAADATAPALISIEGQTRVSVSGGTLDGAHRPLLGLRIVNSAKINVDGLRVVNTGFDGISFVGQGATVWDGGSTITRSEVASAGAAGVRVDSATRVLVLDGYFHDNAGAGLQLGASAQHGAVVGNHSNHNGIGISIDGKDHAVSDNIFEANGTGLQLGSFSANNACLDNAIVQNTALGISLNGANNLVYANRLDGNAADLASAGTTNAIVPRDHGLTDATNRYFYPPTIGEPHSDPHIVNGMGRTDVSVNGGTLGDVQAVYDAARAGNPGTFIVLHLNGAFTHAGAALNLSSFTSVILDGTIDVLATPGPVIKGAAGTQFVSISGGTIDGHNKVMEGINIDLGTLAVLDHVTVKNLGVEASRTVSNSIHLAHGSGYSILRGCRVDVSGGRAIWTQHSTTRYIVVDNYSSNANQDGIDFDSHTANSLAKGNTVDGNTRYGIFIEEGAQLNRAYANTITHNGRGFNLYANASGPTRRNVGFANVLDGNSNGIRVGAINGNTTDENFLFDNVVKNTTGDAILVQSLGTNNYFSNNILTGNTRDLTLDPTGGPNFFNSPAASSVPPTPPPTASPTPTPTPPSTATPTPTPTVPPTATPTPTPGGTPTLGPNLALNKPSSASTNWSSSFNSPKGFDGSDSSRWSASAGSATNQWLGVDLLGPTYYNCVVMKEINFKRVTSHVLQQSDDGVTYTDIPGTTGTTIGALRTVCFDTVVSRYFRLFMFEAKQSGALKEPTVNEVQVYYQQRAPVVSVPDDLSVEATGPDGAAVTYSASATDDKDGVLPVTFDPPSGSTLPLGRTAVTATAIDTDGNHGSGTFNVDVKDTTPPVLTLPADRTVEATGPEGASVDFTAQAQDVVDGAVGVDLDPAPGSTFPLGTSVVTATASDAFGNEAHGTFTITVRDTLPPALSLPADLTLEATGPDGAVGTFEAAAADLVSGAVPVTLSPPSGSRFPLGTSVVTASAIDAAGNAATGFFWVTVRDTTPPALSLPGDLTVEATSASGASAFFAASASDVVSGAVTVTLTPPSGSLFPIGTSTVLARAVDAAGNVGTGSFSVTVRDTTSPVIVSLAASKESLWPPNHKMADVTIAAAIREAVDPHPVTRIVSISSNEPENGTGDGDTAPDGEITGALSLKLRAERAGGGTGRVYMITVESRDRFGNTSTATVTVSVPHDRGR
jgi:hypothetical protein